MVTKGSPSGKITADGVYDYLVEHKMATPLQLERVLGVDMKLIRDALDTLAREGRITERRIAAPRLSRTAMVHTSPPSPRIVPPRHMPMIPTAHWRPEQRSTQAKLSPRSPGIGTQTELPPPPRTVRARIPAYIEEEVQRRIQRTKAEQSKARRKQEETKNNILHTMKVVKKGLQV